MRLTRTMRGSTAFCTALLSVMLGAGTAAASDAYDAAVANPARPAADLKRDPIDHPADMLRLAGIKPGARVADILGGDGYYSELASYVVGPKGHVLFMNNTAFDGWSAGWDKRIASNRLPNVEHKTLPLDAMNLGTGTLDAVLLVKVYHDMYWEDAKNGWPKVNVPKVLDQLAAALKPGGTLLLIDHSAKAGTGTTDAGPLHRIDEAFARKDFESHGFELVGQSDLLRRPDDKRDQISYKPPALGKTDRFVMVFRKKA
jgi:predicted methyltransferase